MAKKSVAVIGGGFTGLVAARRLALKGYSVTLYEAQSELGGLVAGFTLKNGAHLERAYHFLYPTDEYIIGLSKELGIDNKLTFHRSSIGAFYNGKLYPFMTPVDLLKFPGLGFFTKVRTGFVALYLQRVKNWEPLTRITAMEWLNKYNGKKATSILFEPLLKGKFDKYYDKVTMAWLWGRIKQRQDAVKAGEKFERLGYYEGGFNTVAQALITDLKKQKVTIHTNTPIEAIHQNKDGGATITVAGKKVSFDAVLATVPSHIFAKQIASDPSADKAYIQKLTSIDYLDAVLMVISTPQAISDYYWHQFQDSNAPFLVALSLTALTKDTTPYDGNHVYYIGDYVTHDSDMMTKSEAAVRKQWYAGLKELFPDFDESLVQESHVFRMRNAQHIVDVGYQDNKLVEVKTPLQGVYLSNFSQIFPQDRGTNYAVRDGEKAAKLIDNFLKKK